MKIITILGARPQFIKAAALSRVLRTNQDVDEIIIHTGQHYDENMSAVFFQQMQIPEPNYNLNIKSTRHGEMTGQMLSGIESILAKENPKLVLVYGDTNSTLAGALAAAKLHFPVAHVEAGLRSFNMKMPEEINRILTDRISTLLFCPAQNAIENLKREGFNNFNCKVYDVGDIMKDVAYFYKDRSLIPAFHVPDKFVLATIHRAENTDNEKNLTSLIEAFNEIAKTTSIVLPLHPRTRKRLAGLDVKFSANVIVEDPVGYLEMVHLLSRCEFVITDSGGLQKEAYYFNKYCITIRTETEWIELVNAGYNFVTGVEPSAILKGDKRIRNSQSIADNSIYGRGDTATRIEKVINDFLRNSQ